MCAPSCRSAHHLTAVETHLVACEFDAKGGYSPLHAAPVTRGTTGLSLARIAEENRYLEHQDSKFLNVHQKTPQENLIKYTHKTSLHVHSLLLHLP